MLVNIVIDDACTSVYNCFIKFHTFLPTFDRYFLKALHFLEHFQIKTEFPVAPVYLGISTRPTL